MSFILDALKKSEHERQDRAGPDLAYAPGVREREALPRWVYVLGVLLLVNLLAVGGMLLIDSPAPVAESSGPAATGAGATAAGAPLIVPGNANDTAPARTSGAREQAAAKASLASDGAGTVVPAPANELPQPQQTRPLDREAGAAIPLPEPSRASQRDPVPAMAPVQHSAPATVSYSQNSLAESLPPTLDELHGQGRLMDLQALSLDLHVYTEAAAERFVFINLNKYREGERLREGPAVEQITPDGVILQHKGERFLVPRS